MAGEGIQAIYDGFREMAQAFQHNPNVLELARIGVIAFGGHGAQEIVPLTEAAQFVEPPMLTAYGDAQLAAALKLVKHCAELELLKEKPDRRRRDEKPLVFIMIEGGPSDYYAKSAREFKQYDWGATISCILRHSEAETIAVQSQIADKVVALDVGDAPSIRAFFQWVTEIIVAACLAESGEFDLAQLPPLPSGIKAVQQ